MKIVASGAETEEDQLLKIGDHIQECLVSKAKNEKMLEKWLRSGWTHWLLSPSVIHDPLKLLVIYGYLLQNSPNLMPPSG